MRCSSGLLATLLSLFSSINLAGVRFSEAIGYSFPAAVLQSGEFVVLVSARDLAAFQATYPAVVVFGTYLRRFDNGGETITLLGADGVRMLESLSYDDMAPWPTKPDGSGYSLELSDVDANPDDPDSWSSDDAMYFIDRNNLGGGTIGVRQALTVRDWPNPAFRTSDFMIYTRLGFAVQNRRALVRVDFSGS